MSSPLFNFLMCSNEYDKLPLSKFDKDNSLFGFTPDDLIESINNLHGKRSISLKKQLVLIYYYKDWDISKISEYSNIIEEYKNSKLTPREYALRNGYLFFLEVINENIKIEITFESLNFIIFNFKKEYVERILINSDLPDDIKKDIIKKVYSVKKRKHIKFDYRIDEVNENSLKYLYLFSEFSVEAKIQEIINIDNVNIFINAYRDTPEMFYRLNKDLELMDIIIKEVFNTQDRLKSYYKNRFNRRDIKTLDHLKEKYFNGKKVKDDDYYTINMFSETCLVFKYFLPSSKGVAEKLFCLFCESGQLDNAKELRIETGVYHLCEGSYPIVKAFENGQLETAKWLYELGGFDITTSEYMLYENVAFYGMYNTLKWMDKTNKIPKCKIDKIIERCQDGVEKGSFCKQQSKYIGVYIPGFYYNYRVETFHGEIQDHKAIIKYLLALKRKN